MKRVMKWAGAVFAVLLVAVLGLVAWVELSWSVDHPGTPLPAITASTDPDVIARGEYLVHAVTHCSTCHSPGEQVTAASFDFASPLVGGHVWNIGPFGTFTAANITPHETGIGSMSDGEIARVVRHGVDRHGKFSPMMRLGIGPMADEDVQAIISWLRVQEPVAAERGAPQFGFLSKALSRRFKPRLDPPPDYVPEGGISVERGEYLATGPAMCSGCHTPTDPFNGFTPKGPALSGDPVAMPDEKNEGWEIAAPNLTPDPRTGHIAAWTEDQFVARFRAGRVVGGSPMPWEAFALMTEDDVRSLYRYLMSLPPTQNLVGPPYRQKGSFKP